MTKKLAVSNIAWSQHDDPEVLSLLKRHGVGGIEIAPTKIWPDWSGATHQAALTYARRLQEEGFVIPSMQAILYGKPDLQIFGDAKSHHALYEHMALVADIAAAFNAKILVFGAPKNRDRGDLTEDEAFARAVPVFQRLGEICHTRGVTLGLEANPTAYGCNFIVSAEASVALVKAVDSPGVALHIDTGGMHMAKENGADAIRKAGNLIRHVHISEPNLGHFREHKINHMEHAAALEAGFYESWLSIEMRAEADHELDNLDHACRFVGDVYSRIINRDAQDHAA